MLIDYKTGGTVGSGQWFPDERLREVQLPAYALSLSHPPDAIAFAKLRPAQLKLDGVRRENDDEHQDPSAIDGIRILGQIKGNHALKSIERWPELLEQWQQQLDALGQDFLAGKAEVDPRDAQTCRYCHLHALCRIHEHTAFSEVESESSE